MTWLQGIFLLFTGVIVTLLITRVTKWYELLLIGGFGFLLGALFAGAHSWGSLSFDHIWKAFFG